MELHTVILELFFPAVLEAVFLHCFVELFHFIDGEVCIENVHAGPHDFHESHHDDAVQKENHNQIDDQFFGMGFFYEEKGQGNRQNRN